MKNTLKIADYLVSYTIFFSAPIEDNEVFDRIVSATSKENAIQLVRNHVVSRARNFSAREIRITNLDNKEFEYID